MGFTLVFEDEKFYYLVCVKKEYINVETFDKVNFSPIINFGYTRQKKLEDYFNCYLCNDYFKKLISLRVKFIQLDILKEAVKKLGENFCNHFIRDHDRFLFYKDKHAKHFLIDWNKLENNEFPFVQPRLFPFYISYLDVLIDENYDIYHKNQKITTKDVYKLDNEYKKSLIPVIEKKNKIYNAFMIDLEKKYYKTKLFLKDMSLWDYNLEGYIEFFNIAGNVIFEEWVHFETFDVSPCSLKLYGLDMEVNYVLWRLIDAFGLRIVTAKIDIWSEIKTDLQMSFKV